MKLSEVAMKTRIRTEDEECYALVAYLNLLQSQKKILAYTHVPNETYIKSFAGRARRKALGMKVGFPDYIIFTETGTVFIEMKREKGGVISKEQEAWNTLLKYGFGRSAYIAHGFDHAKQIIDGEIA